MANSSRGRVGQENVNEEDDEFSDFGGFEAAEPPASAAASEAQATVSAWAIFSTGNVPGRPDLLCAQNRFPTYLDPSDISSASTESANVNLTFPAENRPAEPQADVFHVQFAENQDCLDQARIAENVLDGTLNTAATAGLIPSHSLTNGRLPDIGLGINENRIFGPLEELNRPSGIIPDNSSLLQLGQEGASVINWGSLEAQEMVAGEPQNDLQAQENVEVGVVENTNGDHITAAAISEAGRVTDAALQERLNSLIERNQVLEQELERVKVDLAAQRSRLHDVNIRHSEDLEEVRKAGHDALAVVVEQYKEQSRAVVMEQQESAQRQIIETLDAQMRAFRDLLTLQQELNEQQKDEQVRQLEQKIEKAVVESREQQQEEFNAFLARQQTQQEDALKRALEAERAASQERYQKAVEEEKKNIQAEFRELEAAFSGKLETERNNHEITLKAVREEEKRLAQEQITLLINEERERSREAVRSALEASMLDVRAYIEQQKQSDARVRRRHLASLDVFLESARHQIALLLEYEKPDPATLPPSHKQEDGSGEL